MPGARCTCRDIWAGQIALNPWRDMRCHDTDFSRPGFRPVLAIHDAGAVRIIRATLERRRRGVFGAKRPVDLDNFIVGTHRRCV
jgi:hypothetical protein